MGSSSFCVPEWMDELQTQQESENSCLSSQKQPLNNQTRRFTSGICFVAKQQVKKNRQTQIKHVFFHPVQEGIYFKQACHLSVCHVFCCVPTVEQLVPPSSVTECKPVRHKSPIRAVSQELVKWSTTTCRATKNIQERCSKWAVDLENLSSELDPRPSLSQRSNRGGMPLMEPTTFSLHERQLTDPLTLWVLGELGLSISLPPPPRLCSC